MDPRDRDPNKNARAKAGFRKSVVTAERCSASTRFSVKILLEQAEPGELSLEPSESELSAVQAGFMMSALGHVNWKRTALQAVTDPVLSELQIKPCPVRRSTKTDPATTRLSVGRTVASSVNHDATRSATTMIPSDFTAFMQLKQRS